MTSTLGRKAARGAAATMAGQVVRFAVQIATVVLLARLLSPEDYGVMALAMVVVGMAEVIRDFGLSSAAIQAKTLSTDQRDNLFWVNVAIGVGLAGVVLVLAGPLGELYAQADVAPITRVMAVVFVINGAATQYRAGLSRSLRFKAVAISDTAAAVLALAVALVVAVAGGGYWALVVQQIVQAAVALGLLVAAGRWLPGLPHRHIEMRRLLTFGANQMFAQMLNYFSRNVDTLIVGIRAGAGELGYYSRAYSLVRVPTSQLVNPASSVAVPVLSRLQDDRRRFDSYLVRGQTFLVTAMALSMGFLAALAGPLVDVLLGTQWAPAVPYLVLLAIGGIFQVASVSAHWALVARGHSASLFHLTLITRVLMIALIALGAIWGTIGVAVAVAVSGLLTWLIGVFWSGRFAAAPVGDLLAAVLVVLAGIGLGSLAAFGVSIVLPAAEEVLRIALGGGAMAAVLVGLWLCWPTFRGRIRGVLEVLVLLRGSRSASPTAPIDPPAAVRPAAEREA